MAEILPGCILGLESVAWISTFAIINVKNCLAGRYEFGKSHTRALIHIR